MTAEDLRAFRTRLGLSRAELARRLRTPYRTLEDWEAGRAKPPGCLEAACKWVESQASKG